MVEAVARTVGHKSRRPVLVLSGGTEPEGPVSVPAGVNMTKR